MPTRFEPVEAPRVVPAFARVCVRGPAQQMGDAVRHASEQLHPVAAADHLTWQGAEAHSVIDGLSPETRPVRRVLMPGLVRDRRPDLECPEENVDVIASLCQRPAAEALGEAAEVPEQFEAEAQFSSYPRASKL
jgi:hypothetical protein